MEEVAAEQHDVGLVLRRQLEDLVEGRERVLLAYLVLLPGSEVVVGGNEDAEDVVGVVGGVAVVGGVEFVLRGEVEAEVEKKARGIEITEGRVQALW